MKFTKHKCCIISNSYLVILIRALVYSSTKVLQVDDFRLDSFLAHKNIQARVCFTQNRNIHLFSQDFTGEIGVGLFFFRENLVFSAQMSYFKAFNLCDSLNRCNSWRIGRIAKNRIKNSTHALICLKTLPIHTYSYSYSLFIVQTTKTTFSRKILLFSFNQTH